MSLYNLGKNGLITCLRNTSFNPYFTGCPSTTRVMPTRKRHDVIEFQSLFYWMSLYNNAGVNKQVVVRVFQSLFYWMSLYNPYISPPSRMIIPRFNPYFTGCPSTTPCFLVAAPLVLCLVSILILLDVPLQHSPVADIQMLSMMVSILILLDVPLQQRPPERPGPKIKSFNPYFTGCPSTTPSCF